MIFPNDLFALTRNPVVSRYKTISKSELAHWIKEIKLWCSMIQKNKWEGEQALIKATATNLLLNGFHVVEVDVSITNCMHKVSWFQPTHMCNHVRQQGIACNVEWYPQSLQQKQRTCHPKRIINDDQLARL
eukprot:m.116748 g.116748  ORF g.116748 m.116748 type:complete len:131 (+) comp13617_c0_seq2:960-1352(+)